MLSITDPELHDAAVNAIAIASVAYHSELVAFRHVIVTALSHGLPAREAADAAGLTCEQVAGLVETGTL